MQFAAIVHAFPVQNTTKMPADDLRSFYAEVFAQDFPLFSGPAEADFRPHRALVAMLARTGRFDALADIVEFALETAERRIAGALAGGVPEAPPAEGASAEYARAFQAAMWITEFALLWAREVGQVAPYAIPRLRRMLAPPAGPFGFFGFLGSCLGYRRFGLPGFFETNADYLCVQRDRLCRELAAPAMPSRLSA